MKNTLKTLVSILIVFSMILSLGVVASASAYETESKTFLYVAIDGSDRNDGSFDAPFKTIEKARDTLRAMKKAGTIGEDGAVVYIRGGKYSVFKSITFTAEDSGTKEAPITYRAYPGEKVELFGGLDVDASVLKPVTDENVLNRLVDPNAREKLMYIDLRALGMTEMPEPELRGAYTYAYGMYDLYGHGAPEATASELIVNGKGQTISRYPNTGWLLIEKVIRNGAIPRNWSEDRVGTDEFVPPELRKNDPFEIILDDSRITKWEKAKDIILYGTFYHTWADQSVYVDKINPASLSVKTTHPSCYGVLKGQSVYFYNLLEEIGKNSSKVAYGEKETVKAINLGAVKQLLVLDSAVAINDMGNLMDMVENMNGEVMVISSQHEGGEQLKGLGSMAAILRYEIA